MTLANELSDDDAVELFERVQQLPWEDAWFEDRIDCASSTRTELMEALAYYDTHRCIVELETPQGQTMLIGGGGSWGDTPGGYDEVRLIAEWGEW